MTKSGKNLILCIFETNVLVTQLCQAIVTFFSWSADFMAHFLWGTLCLRPIISYIKMKLAIQGIVVFSTKSVCGHHVKSYEQSQNICGNRYFFVTKRVAT